VWRSHELRGERLCVVLRLKAGADASATLAAIREHNRKLADWKRVSSYAVVSSEFPRTASMKIKREALAAQVRTEIEAPSPLVAS
jgi:acyl-coenzyme A synthetase/AMP-(fatty) acid ligase